MLTREHLDSDNMLNKEWKDYAVAKMMVYMELTDEQLEHLIDSELLNPMTKQALFVQEPPNLMASRNLGNVHLMSFGATDRVEETRIRWSGIKETIKNTICSIADVIANFDNLGKIISEVLVAVLAVFGGGIGAILLPLVAAMVVRFIKKGKERFCPA